MFHHLNNKTRRYNLIIKFHYDSSSNNNFMYATRRWFGIYMGRRDPYGTRERCHCWHISRYNQLMRDSSLGKSTNCTTQHERTRFVNAEKRRDIQLPDCDNWLIRIDESELESVENMMTFIRESTHSHLLFGKSNQVSIFPLFLSKLLRHSPV